MSIIGFLDPPTTEHFFVVALPLRIRVTSAWGVTIDRIYIASISFSAESGAEQTPSAPIGWPSRVRMDNVDASIDRRKQIGADVPVGASAPRFPMFRAIPRHP